MKKYKTPTIKPHMLMAGRLLLKGSIGNEGFQEAKNKPTFDDENEN